MASISVGPSINLAISVSIILSYLLCDLILLINSKSMCPHCIVLTISSPTRSNKEVFTFFLTASYQTYKALISLSSTTPANTGALWWKVDFSILVALTTRTSERVTKLWVMYSVICARSSSSPFSLLQSSFIHQQCPHLCRHCFSKL